jgi:dolichyl-phosphate beta-glucosyltransferase
MLSSWFYIIVLAVFAVAAAVAKHFGARYVTTTPAARNGRSFVKFARQASSDSGPTVSLVIPCYNEAARLPPMLDETIKFCVGVTARCTSDEASRQHGLFADFELVVVDDCSTDGTCAVVERYQKKYPDVLIRLVKVTPNHGKGYAVRQGFFASSGDYVLMVDGDNATKIDDLCKLFKALRGGKRAAGVMPPVIAAGSRAHLEQQSVASRTLGRTLLMKAFHLVVNVAFTVGTCGGVCNVHDTQCGFKLFDRRVCEILFVNNRLERWAFDVEIFILAKYIGLGAVEVAVAWDEIPGSKMNIRGMVQMGIECLLMCFTYSLGFWPVKYTTA